MTKKKRINRRMKQRAMSFAAQTYHPRIVQEDDVYIASYIEMPYCKTDADTPEEALEDLTSNQGLGYEFILSGLTYDVLPPPPHLYFHPEEVIAFLEQNDFLIDLLWTAYWEVEKHLGRHSLYFELMRDYEGEGEQLFVTIRSRFDEDTTFEKFEAWRWDWWLDNLDKAQGKLLMSALSDID